MKVRWTQSSVRLRITPAELAALQRGEAVSETLRFPNGGAWSATIAPAAATAADATAITLEAGTLRLSLADADRQRLAEPDREGVYFQCDGEPGNGEPALRYFIEKDFPCAHPRAADALEPQTETFVPPPGFGERQ